VRQAGSNRALNRQTVGSLVEDEGQVEREDAWIGRALQHSPADIHVSWVPQFWQNFAPGGFAA
jgi:hypothetical protein